MIFPFILFCLSFATVATLSLCDIGLLVLPSTTYTVCSVLLVSLMLVHYLCRYFIELYIRSLKKELPAQSQTESPSLKTSSVLLIAIPILVILIGSLLHGSYIGIFNWVSLNQNLGFQLFILNARILYPLFLWIDLHQLMVEVELYEILSTQHKLRKLDLFHP